MVELSVFGAWGLGLVRIEGSGDGGTGSEVYSLALLLAELKREVDA
jgi:hypothetical protein